MYKDKDPRAALFAAATKPPQTGLIAVEQVAEFHKTAPQIAQDGRKEWLQRGCNFVLVYGEAEAGASFVRHGQEDEYVVILPDGPAWIEANGAVQDVAGNSIVFVPPGESRVILPEGGTIVRLFTAKAADLLALCPNRAAYDAGRSHIPPFATWPAPEGGYQIRAYSLDVAPQEGRFGRIFRCTTFMVNFLDVSNGPRDPKKLSPHHHDDFEQCSLALAGSFTHHLRWPWTVDRNDWQRDQHLDMGSPSSLVIPPPVIHTTEASGAGANALVDIFCPPRMDFSLQEGWVLNAADYPMPEA
ncbi:hypothetical protein [Paracoccus cavernae]